MKFKCKECDNEDTLTKVEALDEGWKKKGKRWICPDCIDDYEALEDEDEDEDDDDDDDFSFVGGFGGGGCSFRGGSFGGGGGTG